MNVSYKYHTAKGFKTKLAELDRLITAFRKLGNDLNISFAITIANLEQERAELVNTIGK